MKTRSQTLTLSVFIKKIAKYLRDIENVDILYEDKNVSKIYRCNIVVNMYNYINKTLEKVFSNAKKDTIKPNFIILILTMYHKSKQLEHQIKYNFENNKVFRKKINETNLINKLNNELETTRKIIKKLIDENKDLFLTKTPEDVRDILNSIL